MADTTARLRPPGAGPQYYAPQYYAPQYYTAPHYVPQAPINGFAIASFILSLTWFYWVTSILSVVFGILAIRQIKVRDERGHGFAVAGIVISAVELLVLVLVIVLIIVAVASHHSSNSQFSGPTLTSLRDALRYAPVPR